MKFKALFFLLLSLLFINNSLFSAKETAKNDQNEFVFIEYDQTNLPEIDGASTIPGYSMVPLDRFQYEYMGGSLGASSFSHLFTQGYVYKITLTGPQVTYESSLTELQFDHVPQAVIGRLETGNEYEMGDVGTDIASNSFHFETQNTWYDITSYCQDENILVNLDEDWSQHTSATITLLLGFTHSQGKYINFEDLAAGGVQIQVEAFEMVDVNPKQQYITYDHISQSDLQSILQNEGMGSDLSDLLGQPWVYQFKFQGPINADGGYTSSDPVAKFMFGQHAQAAVGIKIKQDGEYDTQLFVSDEESVPYSSANRLFWHNIDVWEDVTNHFNANNIYIKIMEDPWTHTTGIFHIWIGLQQSLGDFLEWENLKTTNFFQTEITGYQILDQQANTIPITYQNVNKATFETIMSNDGAGAFTDLYDQQYIYKINLSGKSGYVNDTEILAHLGIAPDQVIGRGYAESDFPNAKAGTELLNSVAMDESWQDVTAICTNADLYMLAGPSTVTHQASNMYLWVGMTSSLGNSLAYDFANVNFEPPQHFNIQGYYIQDLVTVQNIGLGTVPITSAELATLLNNDGAADLNHLLNYPYLLRIHAKSGTNIDPAVKMQINLPKAPVSAIGRGSGENNPQAAIGDAIDNQYNVDTQSWEDLSQVCNTKDLFAILNDGPNPPHTAGQLDLWFGYNSPPGASMSYQNMLNFLLPDSFTVESYRITSKPVINQVSIVQPANYVLEYLQEGDKYYLDRDYSLLNIPDSLENLIWLKPENSAKNDASDEFITLQLERDGVVYIAYDHRAESVPDWLSGNYELADLQIQVSDFSTPLTVYAKRVTAGQVVLGGNMAAGAVGTKSQYVALIDVQQLQPPVAGFTADTTSGPAPLTVQFTAQTSGDITDWIWEFGGDSISTEQNPTHTFTEPGSYFVMLAVYGPAGSDSLIRNNYITVTTPAPVAAFSADTTKGVIPFTVQFTNESTGNIDNILWSFGDDSTSTESNPSHTYTTTDSFTVTLTVSGPGGADTLTMEKFIIATESAPVADFETDVTDGEKPLTVQFTDLSTGLIDQWTWDFGDGSSSTEQNPSHVYETADSFTVSLTVNGPGGTDVMIKENYIIVQTPSGIGQDGIIPTEFSLYQNHPNPFNPQTTITFDVPNLQQVSIMIYNIRGEQVATLVDEPKAPGRYHVTWNAINHASGTYFIRMETPDYTKINKCILLK